MSKQANEAGRILAIRSEALEQLPTVYLEPPTIPAGMTVETYRKVRARPKVKGIRRISSRAMVV